MAASTYIDIEARDKTQQAFRQVDNSLESLERQTRELRGATHATAVAMGLFDDEIKKVSVGVDTLGRNIFKSRAEAVKFNGIFRDTRGVLREVNGEVAKTRIATQGLGKGFGGASRGAGILTTSVGSLGSALGAIGIASATALLGQFASASVGAAAQLQGFERGLRVVEESRAPERLQELIQVANLPGLNLTDLIQFSNRLRVIGLEAEQTDKILQTVGGVILAMGGNSRTAAEATLQLVQAIETNTVSLQDFRSIAQRVPGFYNAIADTHGVQASIDGFRDAVDATGGSVANALLPVMDTLAQRFGTPPSDSYVVAMDELQNSFFLTQSAIGSLFLPALTDAAFALSNFLENVREGVTDVSALPQPLQDIVTGAKNLYDALSEAASAIANNIGPEIREFAASLGTLLGSVLDLAGSIVNVLEPAFQLWSHVQAVIVAAVAKLAQDLTSIIGVLTDFVDWVSRAWQEEEIFEERTTRVAAAIENVEKATKGASVSVQDYQRDLTTLLTELQSVNTEIEQKKARLKELEEEGLTPADASMAQIVRRIALLEERSKSLTGSLPDLNQALEDVNKQLADKTQRLDEMRAGHEGGSASAQQLERQIANLTTLAALLNAQIALTPPVLEETSEGMNTATVAVENYSLTLARLKAEAEDARDTLSNTIDFQKLGENYRAAIAASDEYYNRQIANAQAALAAAETDSEEYHKIETDLFNLRRDQVEARKKLTEQASAVARTEAERRIKIANEEKERLQQAGEETARALAASQKQQADAAEAEQKRLTQIHQENLKQREEAEREHNARVVKNSEEQLSALSNAFENALPTSVDTAYENIQKATVAHYETLKNQARQRITDEDALNAELVSLDRQRNAALEGNHRSYLQRIASDAKNLLGERTDAFTSASDDILHNWERTVSDFERQLREADTEDAIREIEADFEAGQKNMLASLETVLTELGFTADETAEIMKSIFRTAESESDSFADKVISAFKRLGKEADRETKQQNRQIERNYRELVGEIEHILSNITDFFIEITRGGDIEDAFKQLGERVAGSFLDIFTREISENFAASLTNLALETDVAGAAANRGGGGAGAGGAIQAAGGLTSVLSLITSPIALAAIIPAAVGAATYFIGRQVAGDGTDGPVNRQGRPIRDDQPRQRRGESRAAYESRLQARADAEAAIAERDTFFGNYDPLAPFGRAIQETGIFTGDTGYFAEAAVRQTEIDPFGRVDLPSLVEDLEGILQTRVEGLGADMERAASALQSASGADLQPALQEYFTATTDFYQTQIDFANFVRRTTGHLDFGDVEGLSRQLQQSLNEAKSQAPALDSSTRYNRYQSYLRNQGAVPSQENIDEYNRLADEQGGERHVAAESITPVIESINEGIELINASILSVNTQIEQSNDPAEIAQLLSRVPDLIREKYEMLRQALESRFEAGEISEAVYNASLSELQSNESRDLEHHSDAVLANTLRSINEDVQLIDTEISSIQTQIDGLSEPEVIVERLNQLPALISEKYQKLREALDARYAAGEISVDVYNASLQQLATNESAEIEQHSDAVLSNTLRAIDEDVALIDAEISSIQTQIDGITEPDQIVALLGQLPGLITEKYRLLRDALDERYAADEISTDVYTASQQQLASSEAAETERHSDAVLAQTLADIDDDVELIDANIGALQLAVENSDDPEAIAGLLDAIKLLVADKYKRLRERLDELYAAEEISTDSYNAALLGLETAESKALAGIDTQALNAISAEAQEQVDFINGAIENLRLSFELTDDPEEAQRILDAIKVLVGARFDVLIEELNAIKETLTDDQFSQALKGLELGKQVALENIDTEKFDAISAEAARQVDFINGSIENLRLSFELTDDPTEAQQILDAIKVLTASRFQILRDELNAIKDTLKPEEFAQALKGINLGEQLALGNLDTEKFDAISAEADRQVGLINGTIENLRLSLQLTDDLTEQQDIIAAIKLLTVYRFQALREELEKIRESLKPGEYSQALRALNLGEQLALENIDTEKFNLISEAAQEQVNFINGAIENLRLSFELADDPEARQRILDTIKILTRGRFRILREELEKIKDSFGSEAEYNQAIQGVDLAEQVALKNINTEKFNLISEAAQEQVDTINTDIEQLRLSLELTDDPEARQGIIAAIRALTVNRFKILREELEKIKDSFGSKEEYDRAVKGVNLAEQVALKNLDTEKFGEISAAAQKQVDTLNTDIEQLRISFQLTDDPAERQGILIAIRALIVNRFKILRDELIAIRDTFEDDEDFQRALKGINLGEQLSLKNIDTEKFDLISEAAQKQVSLVDGHLSNLELSLQLTDDPTEIQAILNSIRILTAKRFEILIAELKKIEDTFDSDEEFGIALTGLEIGRDVALQNIDNRSAAVAVGRFSTVVSEADRVIADLFGELAEQTTPEGVTRAVERLRSAIQAKYFVMREKINASAESEEEKARQIAAVNVEETGELEGLNRQGLDAFSSLVNTAQFLLDNATEAEFATRRQELIDAINRFYDERTAFINGLDLSDTDRANMLEVANIQRNVALEAIPQMHESVEERLELEKELQDDIQDLRDEQVEAEADKLQTLADLHQRHNERIIDLEEELNRDLEDLRRDRFDDARADALDYTRDLEDLQTEYARKLFGDSVISFSDLTAEQRRQLEQNTDYQREAFDLNRDRDRDRQDQNIEFGGLTPGSAGYEFYRQQLEGGQLTDENLIRQLFGTQGRDDFIDFEQGTQDADQQLAQGILEATATYETAISENTAAIQALMFPEEAVAITEGAAEAAESASQATDGAMTASEAAAEATGNISDSVEGAITATGTLERIVSALGSPAADLRAAVEGLESLEGLKDITLAAEGLGTLSGAMTAFFEEVTGVLPTPGELIIPGAIPVPELIADSVNVQGTSVFINGSVIGQPDAPPSVGNGGETIIIEATINNTMSLDDGTLRSVGSNQARLRGQRRSS